MRDRGDRPDFHLYRSAVLNPVIGGCDEGSCARSSEGTVILPQEDLRYQEGKGKTTVGKYIGGRKLSPLFLYQK